MTILGCDSVSQCGDRHNQMVRKNRILSGGSFLSDNQTPFVGSLVHMSSVPYQKTLGSECLEYGGGGTNGWFHGLVTGQLSGAFARSGCCNNTKKQTDNSSARNIRPRVGLLYLLLQASVFVTLPPPGDAICNLKRECRSGSPANSRGTGATVEASSQVELRGLKRCVPASRSFRRCRDRGSTRRPSPLGDHVFTPVCNSSNSSGLGRSGSPAFTKNEPQPICRTDPRPGLRLGGGVLSVIRLFSPSVVGYILYSGFEVRRAASR